MYLVFTRWSLCTLYLHGGVYVPCIYTMEFMYLVFTRMPGESYRRRLTRVFVVVLVLRISSAN